MALISFLLEIIGSSYLLVNGVPGTKLNQWLSDKFYYLIAHYTSDIPSRRSMDIVQTYVSKLICEPIGNLCPPHHIRALYPLTITYSNSKETKVLIYGTVKFVR